MTTKQCFSRTSWFVQNTTKTILLKNHQYLLPQSYAYKYSDIILPTIYVMEEIISDWKMGWACYSFKGKIRLKDNHYHHHLHHQTSIPTNMQLPNSHGPQASMEDLIYFSLKKKQLTSSTFQIRAKFWQVQTSEGLAINPKGCASENLLYMPCSLSSCKHRSVLQNSL